jgi:biopolymer transport protein ExbD
VRLHRVKREYGCEINMAPLIDMIFLLIIFFLTAWQVGRVQVDVLTLPEAAQVEKSELLAGGRVVINVHADGRIVVAGSTCEMDVLAQVLRAEQESAGTDDLGVLLRGDRDALWARMSGIMRILGETGISHINVAVLETGTTGPGPQE